MEIIILWNLRRIRTEVKHASTPLKVNLKMQLQKQQMEDQQQRRSQVGNPFSHSTAISMPVTVSALTSDIPQKVTQVNGVSQSLLDLSPIRMHALESMHFWCSLPTSEWNLISKVTWSTTVLNLKSSLEYSRYANLIIWSVCNNNKNYDMLCNTNYLSSIHYTSLKERCRPNIVSCC